ncbi:MAG TPA: grasp-with-spasm system ATP-grasp peptide maturase [Chryseosolibacter sp.]
MVPKGDLSINTHTVPDRVLFHKSINKFLTVENEFLRKHLYSILLRSSALGNFLNTDVNKIDVLLAAKEVGILIPPTLITARKSELISFVDENREIITKPISGAASFLENNVSMSSYTEVVPEQLINSLPDQFPVGLFQKKLEKKYEVRVFYLNGRFYSMAIFSQLDEQTQIDFRRYNYARPNRTVPYKLNSELCEKLHLLMMQLKLNTGSFDLVVDVEDTIYFLEVNPVGQFGMVSYPCNYNLEREIALFLSNEK